MRVVIINGYPTAGKDTFVELCGKYTRLTNIHTSDPAKAALKMLGWSGDKTPEIRDMLALLTEACWEMFNGVIWYCNDKVLNCKDPLMFIHCREPYNIEKLVYEFNALTVLVDRESARKQDFTNEADQNVMDYDYDVTITNNGTLAELEKTAEEFVEMVLGGIL